MINGIALACGTLTGYAIPKYSNKKTAHAQATASACEYYLMALGWPHHNASRKGYAKERKPLAAASLSTDPYLNSMASKY